ncbi:OmpA family protein [uncultured Massilia sp.]|uniref:OmpA family protein n=1 Tax=uncultured Massilia sp. TaxID=169973 RepID=UPI0025848A03|nr:OmpA family protein [uncultured Massilia sp.]
MRIHRLLGFMVFFGAASLAHGQMPKADTVKDAKDHPLLSRFEGSKLVGYDVKEFDEASLPAGKRLRNKDGKWGFEKTFQLEGKVTRIAYNYPKERSSLEVMRNYQAALEKAGLKIAFACAKETCGQDLGDHWIDKIDGHFIKGGGDYWSPFNYGRRDMRYLAASGTRPNGSAVHAVVYVVSPVKDYNGGVYLEIVEGKAMETGKVAATLNAADMAKSITSEGKVAIYGVHFDTGKADVKPDSKPALDEMAKMLQQNQKLKVFVVGHTDNQGELAGNLSLSQKRAEAVVKSLADGYKVDARRLSPKGVASYAPLASNNDDAGRQKNRRVELVAQ